MKKVYVLGLIFSMSLSQVVLATKRTPTGYSGEGRPQWMNGMLNGVGGVVSAGENPLDVMNRKALAETGIATDPGGWTQFAYIRGDDYEVHIYHYRATNDEFYSLKTQTDEPVKAYRIDNVRFESTVENLQWLIPAALESMNEGMEIAINYSNEKAFNMNQNKSAVTGQEQVPGEQSLNTGQSIPSSTQNETARGGQGEVTMSLEGGANSTGGGTSQTAGPANPTDNPQMKTPESGLDAVNQSTANISAAAAGETQDANGKATSNAARAMDAATQQDKDVQKSKQGHEKKA